MTYDEAVTVRAQQLQGQPVDADQTAEALRVIRETQPPPVPRLPRGKRTGVLHEKAREVNPEYFEARERFEVVVPNRWSISPAQAAVLERTAEGNTAGEVGLDLGMEHNTVVTHLGRARKKMGARNNLHAVVMWDRFIREARKP